VRRSDLAGDAEVAQGAEEPASRIGGLLARGVLNLLARLWDDSVDEL